MEKSIEYLWYLTSSMFCFDIELVSIIKLSLRIIKNYYSSDIRLSPIYDHKYHQNLVAVIAYKIALSLLAQNEEIDAIVPNGVIDKELRVKTELYFLDNFVSGFCSVRNISEEFSEIQNNIAKTSPPRHFLENLNSAFTIEKQDEYTNVYIIEDMNSSFGCVYIHDYPLVNYQTEMLCKMFKESVGREMKREMENVFREQFERENLKMVSDMKYSNYFFEEIAKEGNYI